MTALGIALLVIGAVVIVAEAHVPSLGMLGGPGVIAVAAGALLAIDGLGGGIIIAILAALAVTAAGAGVVALSIRKGLAVRRRRVRGGAEGLIGHLGTVQNWTSEPDDSPAAHLGEAGRRARGGGEGKVVVDGGLWRARCSPCPDDVEPELHPGDRVVVERLTGLTLSVRPAEDWELIG